jgi:diguanylate cyclase (GGDEF)-like protein/PAS domain S-box-containing protein
VAIVSESGWLDRRCLGVGESPHSRTFSGFSFRSLPGPRFQLQSATDWNRFGWRLWIERRRLAAVGGRADGQSPHAIVMRSANSTTDDPLVRSSDAVVHQLFEMSSDMLGTASLEGYLTRLNPAWQRTLGWTRHELMGEPFLTFVHPDDVEATLTASAALAQPGRQEVGAFENRYRTSTGDYRWLEWSAIADEGIIYFVARDVTGRKAAEAACAEDLLSARRSEDLHRTLTANLPDTSVFLLDHDLRILVAEGEAIRRLPWYREHLFLGRQVSDLYAQVPVHILELSIENYCAVLQGERREFTFSSGGMTFAVHATPVYGQGGAVESALVVARDITEHQQLTDNLYRSEQRLRKTEAVVGGGSWEVSLDDKILTWSDGLCQIHGASPVDSREPLSAYVERVNHAERTAFREEISRCAQTGRGAFEYRITRPDGAVRTLTVETELVDPGDGQTPFVRGAALDVTDERAGFDAAPLGMLVAEPEQLRLVRVNDALCSILGRPREELLGQRIIDLTHPNDRGSVAKQKQILTSGTAGTYETEKRYLRPDGSTVWVAVYMIVLHSADGSVRAFSSQVIDITERRNRAAEVTAARVESLRRLATATEYRDNETYEHTERVGRLSVTIGPALGVTEPQLDLLRQAASLHDIGKVGISDVILLKSGRLTAEERQVMERHTLIGADILSGSDSSVLKMAEEIALTHHERWDGNGYPNKLAAETIPLVGRIVAIADAFDALTHERPYKEAWPVDRAVRQICDESGSHFDPTVVSAFKTLDHTALASPERGGEKGQSQGWRPAHAEAGAGGGPSDGRADERSADRDRAAGARDRAASERDEIAAERDQSEAEADKRTSSRDHAASDRDHAASLRATTASARDRLNAAADLRSAGREKAASERELAALDRDGTAARRDQRQAKNAAQRASDRNRAVTDRELAARDRTQTESDRDQSQIDMTRRASDRADAATEREHAVADSSQTASDRGLAQSEAEARHLNRDRAARDRALAAVDRNQTAADRLAATADRDQARDELRRAQIDPLTGALGRALGTVALEREINRARHGNGKLVLGFLDIDGLKQVNDRNGHAAGDLVLRGVVDAMQRHLRSYDPIVRLGGDEFVCALVDATAKEVERLFKVIQATIADAQPGTSISFGLAELRPDESLEELTARGDRALYRAKLKTRQLESRVGGQHREPLLAPTAEPSAPPAESSAPGVDLVARPAWPAAGC